MCSNIRCDGYCRKFLGNYRASQAWRIHHPSLWTRHATSAVQIALLQCFIRRIVLFGFFFFHISIAYLFLGWILRQESYDEHAECKAERTQHQPPDWGQKGRLYVGFRELHPPCLLKHGNASQQVAKRNLPPLLRASLNEVQRQSTKALSMSSPLLTVDSG